MNRCTVTKRALQEEIQARRISTRYPHRRLGTASVLALAVALLTGCSGTAVTSETPAAFDANTYYCGQFFAAHNVLTALAGIAASGQVDATAAQEAMPAVQSGFVPLLDPAVGEDNDAIAPRSWQQRRPQWDSPSSPTSPAKRWFFRKSSSEQ